MEPSAPGAWDLRYCSECGVTYPIDDLARFGERWICANCKPLYAQRLREGAAPAPALVYAGFWIRVVAAIIDGVILYVIGMVVSLATGVSAMAAKPSLFLAAIGLSYAINTAIAASYEAFLVSRYGATPGKMALGLKVVTAEGGSVSLGRAFGRYFAKLLNGFTLGIGFLLVAFDGQKRGLHDMICNTRVMRSR